MWFGVFRLSRISETVLYTGATMFKDNKLAVLLAGVYETGSCQRVNVAGSQGRRSPLSADIGRES